MQRRRLTGPSITVLVMSLALAGVNGSAAGAGPSFDCSKASGTIEEMICRDDGLAALDRKPADVYAADAHPPTLKAEQRGWIKGRNGCWKNNAPRASTEERYRLRIAELQALLPPGAGTRAFRVHVRRQPGK